MEYEIEYLGGYPEWRNTSKAVVKVVENEFLELTESGFWSQNRSFRIHKDDIVNISFEKAGKRSAGKAAAGAIIGGVLTGGLGLLAGAAIGARKKNLSELYIYYNYKGRELMLSLKTGKKTEQIYAELNGLFA